jgi:hypothetical protein
MVDGHVIISTGVTGHIVYIAKTTVRILAMCGEAESALNGAAEIIGPRVDRIYNATEICRNTCRVDFNETISAGVTGYSICIAETTVGILAGCGETESALNVVADIVGNVHGTCDVCRHTGRVESSIAITTGIAVCTVHVAETAIGVHASCGNIEELRVNVGEQEDAQR